MSGSSPRSARTDATIIAFSSDHTNLVTGDTNARRDVFVFDRP
ncbi:MAG: hypothetical protein RIF32_09450 [Leptospirales bacterium]